MTTRIARVHVPPVAAVPPGAAWLAAIAVQALQVVGAGIRLATTAGRLRAEQRRSARAARRHARDRDALYALARSYASSQPGFAKDLFAAAARDERG